MSNPIDAIGATLGVVSAHTTTEVPESGAVAGAFERLLDGANLKLQAADVEVQKLALGQADSLHGVMIAVESAKESLALVVQIRNRLVDAYQDVLRMQI